MLIADDDPAIIQVLARVCARVGFEVETASDGLQAVLKAKRFKPDVLIVDLNMPGVDGISVCMHLLHFSRANFEFIIIAEHCDQDTAERCTSTGGLFCHKGPRMLIELASALRVLFPRMAGQLREMTTLANDSRMQTRPRVLSNGFMPNGNAQFLAWRLRTRAVTEDIPVLS